MKTMTLDNVNNVNDEIQNYLRTHEILKHEEESIKKDAERFLEQ